MDVEVASSHAHFNAHDWFTLAAPTHSSVVNDNPFTAPSQHNNFSRPLTNDDLVGQLDRCSEAASECLRLVDRAAFFPTAAHVAKRVPKLGRDMSKSFIVVF